MNKADKEAFQKALKWLKTEEGKQKIREALEHAAEEAKIRNQKLKLTPEQWKRKYDLPAILERSGK